MERSTDARSPATSTDGKPTNLDSNQAAAASAQHGRNQGREIRAEKSGRPPTLAEHAATLLARTGLLGAGAIHISFRWIP